jgi:hypothetical protein
MTTTHSMVLRHGYSGTVRYRILIAKTNAYGSVGYHREVEESRPNLLGQLVWLPCRPVVAFELLVRAWCPVFPKECTVAWQSDSRRICVRHDIRPDAETRSVDHLGAERWWTVRRTTEEDEAFDGFSARLLEDLCRGKFPDWWRMMNADPVPRPWQDIYAPCRVCGAEGDDSFELDAGGCIAQSGWVQPPRVICRCCGGGRDAQ